MDTTQARSTNRLYRFDELLLKLPPDELKHGEFLDGVKSLTNGSHPLPTIFLRYDIDGKLHVVGNQTRNILATLLALRTLASMAVIIRRLSGYEMKAIVIEYTAHQYELIEAYKEAGFL